MIMGSKTMATIKKNPNRLKRTTTQRTLTITTMHKALHIQGKLKADLGVNEVSRPRHRGLNAVARIVNYTAVINKMNRIAARMRVPTVSRALATRILSMKKKTRVQATMIVDTGRSRDTSAISTKKMMIIMINTLRDLAMRVLKTGGSIGVLSGLLSHRRSLLGILDQPGLLNRSSVTLLDATEMIY